MDKLKPLRLFLYLNMIQTVTFARETNVRAVSRMGSMSTPRSFRMIMRLSSLRPTPLSVPRPTRCLPANPWLARCDVLIFHPRHDLTLARLSLEDIARIIDEWTSVYRHRGSQASIKYVQIFEVPFH